MRKNQNHTEALIELANHISAGSYLEIGVRSRSANFDRIPIASKVGIDPRCGPEEGDGWAIIRIDSDSYFAALPAGKKFSLIFVDGDHTNAQSGRDLDHALDHLATGGAIVLHDSIPVSSAEAADTKPPGASAWTGGVYQTVLAARMAKTLLVRTIDTDHGITIITKRKARAKDGYEPLPADFVVPLTFSAFRKADLNIIDPAKLVDGIGGARA